MESLVRTIPGGLTIGAMCAISAVGLTLIWGVLHVLVIAHGTILVIGGISRVFVLPIRACPSLTGAQSAAAIRSG